MRHRGLKFVISFLWDLQAWQISVKYECMLWWLAVNKEKPK